MKKLFLFGFIITLCVFGIYNTNFFKSEILANMENKYNLIICIDNLDDVSDEYKEKFWNLSIPLTFKTSNRDIYQDFKEDNSKLLTNSIIVPRKYMSLVASGDANEIRNTIYNSVSIAKEQGICILILKINQENEETLYYALCDSMSIFNVNKINLQTFNFMH